jgi:pectin methylesterase-like acyl-CoA thioesterase
MKLLLTMIDFSFRLWTLSLLFALSPLMIHAQKAHPVELTVAQDGSGDYRTIQEAVQACRDLGEKRVKIHIRKGIYREKLIIPSWKTNLSLIGEDRDSVIITDGPFAGIEAIYQTADAERRAFILLEILSKPVSMQIDTGRLRKAG